MLRPARASGTVIAPRCSFILLTTLLVLLPGRCSHAEVHRSLRGPQISDLQDDAGASTHHRRLGDPVLVHSHGMLQRAQGTGLHPRRMQTRPGPASQRGASPGLRSRYRDAVVGVKNALDAFDADHDSDWDRIPKALLRPFLDLLPIPQVIDGRKGGRIVVGAYQRQWRFHRNLPAASVYAFGTSAATASVPGPTILAAVGVALEVQWENHLAGSKHLFPVDPTLGVPDIKQNGLPYVPHLHGASVQSTSDGHPDAWFTASGATGPSFASSLYAYPNQQPGATLWYHDHTVGMTRLNVEAGLFGAYLLEDAPLEAQLNLPAGQFDVPLVFQDKTFEYDGDMYVPKKGDNPSKHPSWVPESFNSYQTINGKVSPYLPVQRRKYRLRLINGNLARFLGLSIRLGLRLLRFSQVASDAGFLPQPVSLTYLLLAPGERAEIVVDFSQAPVGARPVLFNNASAPYPDGDPASDPFWSTAQLLQFRVGPLLGTDTSALPASLVAIPPLQPQLAVNYPDGRPITLSEIEDPATGKPDYSVLEGKHWMAPADIVVKYGTAELWDIINLTGDMHPVHIHFVAHRVVQRRPFNATLYAAGQCTLTDPPASGVTSCFTGPSEAPAANEGGFKDTSQCPPSYVTRLLLQFVLPGDSGDKPSFDPSVGPGYVIHCHILDHEDNDMMRPYKVEL